MCMTEQSELSYQAMDETAEWGSTHVRMPNVIHLRRVHELEPHVMPESPIRPIHVWIAMLILRAKLIAHDFAAFWSVVDWSGLVVRFLALAIAVMAVCWGGQELSMVDWSALAIVPFKN